VPNFLFDSESRLGIDPTTNPRARSRAAALALLAAPPFTLLALAIAQGPRSRTASVISAVIVLSSMILGFIQRRGDSRIPFEPLIPLGGICALTISWFQRGELPLSADGIFASLITLVATFLPARKAVVNIAFLLGCYLTATIISRGTGAGPAIFIINGAWVTVTAVIVGSLRTVVVDLISRLDRQSKTDDLTGLPNRISFQEHMLLQLGDDPQTSEISVLLIDLDRFKDINDTLGHRYGDLLLQSVSQRLTESLRSSDFVARLGGDEFAVVLTKVSQRSVAERVAKNLVTQLSKPFMLDGSPVMIGASIGVAVCPTDGVTMTALLQAADLAMFEAKERRVGVVEGLSAAALAPRNAVLLGELREAIENNQLVLHYQPKVSLPTGDIIGAEALVRWQHPRRGLVMPDEFIPVAERTGLISALTTSVLRLAITQAVQWHNNGHQLPIAVNISARSLLDPNFVETVIGLLHDQQSSPDLLYLEITESAIMKNPAEACAVLARLRVFGVRISIDDFGTGHSSLAYLRSLPADELKIDRTFVSQLDGPDNDELIVTMAIQLAHAMGMKVVAEGVERAAVEQRLFELGCDTAQGYFYSRPVPADQFPFQFSASASSQTK
jgi:diguanylate cyclase